MFTIFTGGTRSCVNLIGGGSIVNRDSARSIASSSPSVLPPEGGFFALERRRRFRRLGRFLPSSWSLNN